MKTLFRLHVIAAALIAAMALGACDDDDDGPTGTGNDTTPPAVGSITSMDSTHVSVRFSEQVDRTSAETEGNYTITQTGPPSPGDPIPVLNASLLTDTRTVVLTTSAMSATGYTMTVIGVADTRGNVMDEPTERTFPGKATPDETAPQIVVREPSNNETNVALNAPIAISFSEPVLPPVFNTAFTLSVNGGEEVAVNIITTDNVHFVVQPVAPLALNTTYHVSLVGVRDASLNLMQEAEWNFHTTSSGESIATGVRR